MSETVFTVEATPIVFGPGASDETGFHVARLGVSRAMLVSDPHVTDLGITERVRTSISARGIDTEIFDRVHIEPNERSVLDAIEFASGGEFDGFVGIGGGSSIDTAKLAALFTTHGGELLDMSTGRLVRPSQLRVRSYRSSRCRQPPARVARQRLSPSLTFHGSA